ncbi:class I SAM-dependent methyltransferase [Cyanobacteria bacterium FACHB-472]|nr:class I SAM-dependent methyltransferase [Cyanobacteria bacterium FACHB-472]
MDTKVIPSILDINNDYLEFYDYVSKTQRIEKRLESFENYISFHYKDLFYIKAVLGDLANIKTIVDIGCCGTPYPDLFALETVDYIGIDISQISLDRMAEVYKDKKIKWVVDDICKLNSLSDNSVDLILATQVFEHVPNPEEALIATVSKLKIGGRLMIGTEAALFISTSLTSRLGRWLTGVSFYLGSIAAVYGTEPLFYLHRETLTFTDSQGNSKTVKIPHGHFHPRYFQVIIDEYNLPAKITFVRVTDGIRPDNYFKQYGSNIYFKWLEAKSKIPVLRYLGNQIFIVIEKLES